MEENCLIVGLNHENEVELELGLSIGGSFKRIEKLKPFKKDQIRNPTPDSGPQTAAEQESDHAAADPRRKREIQAMRRKEAKIKREEKQQKRGLSCKKMKVEFSGSSDGETKNSAGAPNPTFCSAIPVRVPVPPSPYPYPYPQVQGFVYPCGTTGTPTPPCVSGGNAAVDQGFRPFKGCQVQNSGSGLESDPNSSCCKDDTTRIKKSGSNGSTVCTGLQTSSNHGGSSSNIDIGPKWQLEETATSHQTKPSDHHTQEPPAAAVEDKKRPLIVKDDSNNNIVDSENKAPPPPLCSLPPCMPCVSTRGDGPNGRTVNGFLYRYSSQTEVSIVCVCHGSSFSPAEFVEHAGGTAVSQPLRHITVVPSAF